MGPRTSIAGGTGSIPYGVAWPKKKKDFLHPVLANYIFVFETFLCSISRLMTATLAL